MVFNMEIIYCTPIWAPKNIPFWLRGMEICPQDKIEETEKNFTVKPYLSSFYNQNSGGLSEGPASAGVLVCLCPTPQTTPWSMHLTLSTLARPTTL